MGVSITDGDTVTLLVEPHGVKVRIGGIDTPETTTIQQTGKHVASY